MKFQIALKIDEPAGVRSAMIQSLSEEMRAYFLPRDYGKDVQEYLLLLICVGKKFDYLFAVNKPFYVDHKVRKNRFTGGPIEMNKVFMNDVKLDQVEYAQFVTGDEADAKRLLIRKILGSLSSLDSLPRKVKDFDRLRFEADMQEFFRQLADAPINGGK
jgi:hypothetical protein